MTAISTERIINMEATPRFDVEITSESLLSDSSSSVYDKEKRKRKHGDGDEGEEEEIFIPLLDDEMSSWHGYVSAFSFFFFLSMSKTSGADSS